MRIKMLTVDKISQEMIENYLFISKKSVFPKRLLPNLKKLAIEYFKIKKSFEDFLEADNFRLFEREKNDTILSIGINENIMFASVWFKNHVIINSSLNNTEEKKPLSTAFPTMRASFTLSGEKEIEMYFDMPHEDFETDHKAEKTVKKSYRYSEEHIEYDSIDIKRETKKLINFIKTDFQTTYENNLIQANNKIKKVYYLGEVLLELLKEDINVEDFLKYDNSYLYNEINEKIDLISDFLSLNNDINIVEKVNKFKSINLTKPQYPRIKK